VTIALERLPLTVPLFAGVGKSQFPHKAVNLSFILKNKLTDL
jgi:hypothetical protein